MMRVIIDGGVGVARPALALRTAKRLQEGFRDRIGEEFSAGRENEIAFHFAKQTQLLEFAALVRPSLQLS